MQGTQRLAGAALLITAALLAGCAAAPGRAPQPGAAAEAADPVHGYIAGAEEMAGPQTRLATVDSATGRTSVLDLTDVDGAPTTAGTFPGTTALAADGRYAFLANAATGTVQVVDAGGWAVDHGDHKHYYRAPVRGLGRLDGAGAARVAAGDGRVAVFFADGGYAAILEREDLDAGVLRESVRITTGRHDGVVVPFAGHFAASIPGGAQDSAAAGDRVEIRATDNSVAAAIDPACPGLAGHAVVRKGVVFNCADGALLVSEDDGTFTGRKIPYPAGTPAQQRAVQLSHRPGTNELAGPAGTSGIWHLDVAAGAWTLLPTGSAVLAAAAVGDGRTVLAVDADGALSARDAATGSITARTPLLAPGGALPDGAAPRTPALAIDTSRAYLNDPATGAVYEIDYADALRTARTLDAGHPASLLVETGR